LKAFIALQLYYTGIIHLPMLDNFDLLTGSGAFIVLAAFIWLLPRSLEPLDASQSQPQATGEGIDVSGGVPDLLTAPLVEKVDNYSGTHAPPSNLPKLPLHLTVTPTILATRGEDPIRSGASAPENSLNNLSDAAFDYLVPLGKSSTRVSHKVQLRATGAVYVRKSMTPHQVLSHDIVMGLIRMTEVRHPNIVKCFSVYPIHHGSYEEVGVIMEFCEGGSLASVREAIKDRAAVVGEKVVGRITEGVRFEPHRPWLV
jgi:hypothetical protein